MGDGVWKTEDVTRDMVVADLNVGNGRQIFYFQSY